MDRVIENKRWIKKKYIPYLVGGALALILVIWLIFGNHLSTLKVDKRLLTIEPAQQGQFNDYVRVNGQVQPVTTIQLSPLESGMVEEKLVEEGAMVHKGQVIVRLSNSSLSIAILQSEADLAEKDNFLRNTMVSMEQQKLDLQKERLSLNIDVQRKERKYRQNERLYKEKLIAREDYLQAKEDYELALETRHVVQERQKQDSIYRTTQIESLEENLQSMRQNMMLIRQRMDNLNVKSPIDGQLGTLDAELGQSVSNTVKIGQINDLSDYISTACAADCPHRSNGRMPGTTWSSARCTPMSRKVSSKPTSPLLRNVPTTSAPARPTTLTSSSVNLPTQF